LGTEDGSS